MPIGDYDVCVNEADAFLETAKWCERDIESFITGGMYPCIVNAVFSCELYMKAIMICNSVDKKFEKGHELEKLFSLLPLTTQTEIEKTFNKENTIELKQFLKKINLAFEEWRYAFENGVQINETALLSLANILHRYVKDNRNIVKN